MSVFENIDFHAFAESLIRTIEVRDLYTAGHSKRVSEFSELICRKMEVSEAEREFIHIAGHFHDIGKIGISDGILLKSGRLSDAEYVIVQEHPVIGASIFDKPDEFKEMSAIIRHHHERYDGKGYPDGLKGNDIPIGAAIISVVDSFDAMTTSRPYRPTKKPEDAIKEIIQNSGTQFNPQIADIFVQLFRKNKKRISTIINSEYIQERRHTYKSFCSIKTSIQKKELIKNIRKK